MNTYNTCVLVTYSDGRVRTLVSSVTTTSMADAVRMTEDDEGYSWPEKTAKRETLYVIKEPV